MKLFSNQSVGLVGEVICRKLLTDRRTDDDDAGRRTVSDHKSSPRTSCLGELKTVAQVIDCNCASSFFMGNAFVSVTRDIYFTYS